MKKRNVLSLVMASILSLSLLSGCGSKTDAPAASTTPDAEAVSLKMHLSCGTTDYVYTAGEKFAELVKEKSGGKLNIELYPSSSLGTTADCLEGLSIGACNIVFDSVGNLSALTPLANIDAAPYMYDSIDHYRAVTQGEVGKTILADIGADCGKTLLGYGLQGVRVMTTVKPIYGPADVEGMKLRVPTISIYLDTWSWLGANPTPMAAADIFTALQQKTVEGQENPYGASVGLSMQDVCKYVTESNHVYSGNSFIFDTNYFNSLPAEYQTVLSESAFESAAYLTDLAESAAAEKKQVFVDAGAEIIETDVADWQAALDGFLAEKYPDLVKYADMIAAAKA